MLLLTSIQVVACAYVLCVCCMVLNRMGKHTRHMMRWSYLAWAGGAFAGIICDLSIPVAIFSCGLAVHLACEERSGDASQRKSLS